MAVAQLVFKPEEAPNDSVRRLVDKLKAHGDTYEQAQIAIQKAQQTIREMSDLINKTAGAVEALTDVISDAIPYELAEKLSSEYTPPQLRQQAPPDGAKAVPEPDVAGSTSKQLDPPKLDGVK